ncbi:MAG: XRE family transcriptional regulator [Burkholderiales bacterium]
MLARTPVKARRHGAASLDRERVGERLRALRKSQKLTLKALAERSGVALSTLSKIELGQISVSYEKLAAAAHALDADIAQLFDARAAASAAQGGRRQVVVRSTPADAPSYDADNYDYRMLATDFSAKRMTPLLGTIVARELSQFPDYIRHAGQEFVMVLSGKVRLLFETGEAIELARRESAYFDSGVGHVYLSTSKGDAQVVVVMSER